LHQGRRVPNINRGVTGYLGIIAFRCQFRSQAFTLAKGAAKLKN